MFERGYWQVTRWRGTPLRIHWSMPLGALLFGGLQFAPAFWAGFLVLILVHELGHAVLVRRYGHRVLSIDLTGFGGLTRWSGYASDDERSVIAWGGVLAQLALLVVTVALLVVFGAPQSGVAADLASVFVRTNLWIMGLNLLPFPPFDGAHAWRGLPRLAARLRSRLVDAASRARHRAASRPSNRREGPSSTSKATASPNRELADLLERIGRDAGQARRR